MKLFTKDIDKKLFAQFPKGGDLANQKVIAKIFNPYGRGIWYIINSDPNDPDYLWAIVKLFEVEVGSVSRKELESLRIKPFMLPLERDLYFDEKNALEVYEGASRGERFKEGGSIGFLPMELEENIAMIARWGMTSMQGVIGFLNAMIDSGVTDEDLVAHPIKRTSFQVEKAIDKKTKDIWKRIEPNYKGGLLGNTYYSIIRKMVETTKYRPTFLAEYKPFRKLQKDSYAEGGKLSDANYLVGMAEEYAQVEYEKPVKKGQGTAKANKNGDTLEYTEVTVFFKDGTTHLFTKKDFPKFFNMYAKGGSIENQYEGRTAEDIWDSYNKEQRLHFLYDHADEINAYKGLEDEESTPWFNKAYKSNWNNLDDDIKNRFSNHVRGGQYAKGGLTFDEKVNAVEKSLMSREVPKKYRNLYGRTFNKEEAHESAQKIIGAQIKKYNKK